MFGDAISDLKACVADPNTFARCRHDEGDFRRLLASLAALPPNQDVLVPLSDGLKAAPGTCAFGGGAPNNQFCMLPDAVADVFRIHAKANPDVAVTLLVDDINAWLRSDFDAGRASGPGGFFDKAIATIVENLPATASASTQARAIVFLQDISAVRSDPDLAARATAALQQIAARQQAQKQQQVVRQQQQEFVQQQQQQLDRAATRKKVILLVTVGIAVVGGGGLLIWQLGRRSRVTPLRPRRA